MEGAEINTSLLALKEVPPPSLSALIYGVFVLLNPLPVQYVFKLPVSMLYPLFILH
jgi:hypothetical protein